MTDHDPLIARLHDLGSQPVDTATASQHLTALSTTTSPALARDRKWSMAKVAGIFTAGLFIGGTGLASAGALPDTVQDKVAVAAAKVGVDLPRGTARYTAAECGVDADGKPIEWRNHGQYLKSLPKDQREAASANDCGKPLRSVGGDDTSDADDAATPTSGAATENGSAACEHPGKGRGAGHASDKASEKANDKAKAKAGALDDSEPASKPGKPDCIEDKKPAAPVTGQSTETDDPPPADEEEGVDDDTSGRPTSPGTSQDHGARDQQGRSFDDAPPSDDESAPAGPDDMGGTPADDPANPYDDPEPED